MDSQHLFQRRSSCGLLRPHYRKLRFYQLETTLCACLECALACNWFCRTLRKYSSALGCCNSLIPRSSPHVLFSLPLHLFPMQPLTSSLSHKRGEYCLCIQHSSAKPHAPHAVQRAVVSICLVCDFKLECVAPEFPCQAWLLWVPLQMALANLSLFYLFIWAETSEKAKSVS